MKTFLAGLLGIILCGAAIAGDSAASDEAVARAVALYPDTAVEGSVLFVAVQAERLRLERENPLFFKDEE